MARSKKLKLQNQALYLVIDMTLLILNLWKCVFTLWRMHPFQKIRKNMIIVKLKKQLEQGKIIVTRKNMYHILQKNYTLTKQNRVWCCCCLIAKSYLTLFVIPWTPHAPLSMGSPRQEYQSCCHFLLQGMFPTQGLNLCLLLGRPILYYWATWDAQIELELAILIAMANSNWILDRCKATYLTHCSAYFKQCFSQDYPHFRFKELDFT